MCLIVTHVPLKRTLVEKVTKVIKPLGGGYYTPYQYTLIEGLMITNGCPNIDYHYGRKISGELIHSCVRSCRATVQRVKRHTSSSSAVLAYAIGVKCYGTFNSKGTISDNVGSVALYVPITDTSPKKVVKARIAALESQDLDKIIEQFPQLAGWKKTLLKESK